MWDSIIEDLGKVTKYYISETIDCKKNYHKIGKNIKAPCFIGPVRDIIIDDDYDKKNYAIINYGGAESFMTDIDLLKKFYFKITKEILSALENLNLDKIYVTGGEGILEDLHYYSNERIVIESITNKNFLELIKHSKICVISSGLGNFIETLYLNASIIYIPPVSYSQFLQLCYYEDLNLGFPILNWNKFNFYINITQGLNEMAGIELVMENIKKYNESNDNTVSCFIDNANRYDQSTSLEKRREYLMKYDKNAALIVANDIISNFL